MVLNSSTLAPQNQPQKEEGSERIYSQPERYVYNPFLQFLSRYIKLCEIPPLVWPYNEFQIRKQIQILKRNLYFKKLKHKIEGSSSFPTKYLFISRGGKHLHFLQQLHSLEVKGCSLPTIFFPLGRINTWKPLFIQYPKKLLKKKKADAPCCFSLYKLTPQA